MRLKQFVLLPLFLFVSGLSISYSQHAGGYTQHHFSTRLYNMHPRNFYVMQDKREVMYFGNAYGVIEYDGTSWRDIPLTNGNSALSLRQADDGYVYVGSYNELGYLKTDSAGSTVYQSLYSKVPESKQLFETVYDIFQVEKSIIYFTSFGFYLYEQDTFRVIPVSSKENLFQYACQIHNSIYVNQVGVGLCMLGKSKVELLSGGDVFRYNNLKEILALDKDRLLVLEDNGLFVFESGKRYTFNAETNRLLSREKCTHAVKLRNGSFLIATLTGGIYVLDSSGKIVKHIHQGNGLPSNMINYAFIDKREALWLALDNGISYIEINSPFTYTGSSSGISGMGYSAALFDNKLYLGTSQGLFVGDPEGTEFKPVKGVSGEIWNLSVINNTLLCCQTDYLYQVSGDAAKVIPCPLQGNGNWKIIPLRNHPDYAIEGTYEGFLLYRLVNGNWKFERKLKGFDESSRVFVQQEDNIIWMCHGNKGIYKVTISDDLTKISSAVNFSEKNGLAPDFFNEVTLVNNELVFASGKGLYKLDKDQKIFVKHSGLEKITGENIFISKLFQHSDKNLWLFGANDVWLFRRVTDSVFKKEEVVFRKVAGGMVGSYEFMMPVNKSVTVIGSQEGFIFYNDKQKTQQTDLFPVMVRKIEATFKDDSLLYGGNNTEKENVWEYDLNDLRFTYSALYYENPERLRYQYALTTDGNDEIQWSGWTANTQVEFSGLYEGNYTFHVRAKNIYEEYSRESAVSFVIRAPWYRSVVAYVIYGTLVFFFLFLLTEVIRKRFRRQREKLEEEKRKELLIQEQKHITENLQVEKELIELRNAKLEGEMLLKNTELASLATTLTQKSEFLLHLKEKLEGIQENQDKPSDPAFKAIIKTIDQDLDFDDDWAKFQIHFDQLHHNFLHRLREKFPKLKPSWLLLCAYIRMNKSNKEIASHLNISVAGIEKRKYRLKEKLELGEDVKLSDYLINL